jgi:two-component system C4-dicarboxylate transport sensor histidine kinase DctB
MKVVVLTELRGRARWYDMTLEPIRDARGHVTAALVVGRDIHELRQARQELEEYRDRMARAEQLASLGTLGATIAHELTQPLTVSRLSLQEALAELRESGLSKAVMEALGESLDGIADAATRVGQFRNFAQKSSQELPSIVQLREVVTRTIRLLKGRARECNMSLIVRGLEDLPEILAHEKNMEQMCFALMENAIQAASEHRGRRLTVTGGTSGSHLYLRFEDNCGGIPPEHLDKIFQPFFTTKSPGEGTGLGLCIVERVVTQAQGKVRVENQPGKGVAFCITLPADVR